MTVLFALFGCGGPPIEDPPNDSAVGAGPDDARIADLLWQAAAEHDGWTRPDGWTATPTESADHVGLFVVRFDNPTLAGWDGTGSAPEGSISLKEEYDADGVLQSNTAMEKLSGYDAAHSDWFWAKYDADGATRTAGQVAMCWGCHAEAPVDYLHTEPPSGP